MDRVILHSDMNSFFASVELVYRPELRGKAMAVCGDPQERHGIVLAKDPIAKKAGVKTGMPLWMARQKCPEIVFVPSDMSRYLRFSRLAHEIYAAYTDRQEPYGIDECWLDISQSTQYLGDGEQIAKEISRRIRQELGVTVSIGISWNKIFAKLGSDYKKPDAITAINRENYRRIAWPLPVGDLLFVGAATKRKLLKMGIYTIGQLAGTDPAVLHAAFGKVGLILSVFARGEDCTPVAREDCRIPVKSIGNSTTTPRDLVNDEDVRITLYVLAESVAARLRESNFKCSVVEIWVRDNQMLSFCRQCKIPVPTNITAEIAQTAIQLFRANYDWNARRPIRSIGVRGCELSEIGRQEQLNLFIDQEKREKLAQMDRAMDSIRDRFGFASVQRGLMYQDVRLSSLNAKEEHVIHPKGYLQEGNRLDMTGFTS